MLERAAGLAYREERPDGWSDGDRTALLVHGFPASSHMWLPLMAELAGRGVRAVAPDLAGFGDSPPDPPGTWERHVASLARFAAELGLERVMLVVHDWGCLIGLRWACEHAEVIESLVISDGGFFPDGKWHGLGKVLREEGAGERLVESFTVEGFRAMLRQTCPPIEDAALDDYWKCLADAGRRTDKLELYRSGDFEKLAPYEGCLGRLGVPALLVWGTEDPFAPVAGAHRLHRELPGSKLALIEGAGHFVWEEEPLQTTAAVLDFMPAS